MLTLSGKKALIELLDMREDLPESGLYPFLMGDEDALEISTENFELNEEFSVSEIIENSKIINLTDFFEEGKAAAMPIDDAEFNKDELIGRYQHIDSNQDAGLHWKELIMSHHDILTKIPFEKCYFGIVKTTQSWEVPAFVRFGNWNSCPSPAEHCAVFRHWQEKYGAEILSITDDVIECCVTKPPQTEDECWELAWEQYGYCPDIVDQGVGTIGALASSLRDSSYWYFWWD